MKVCLTNIITQDSNSRENVIIDFAKIVFTNGMGHNIIDAI